MRSERTKAELSRREFIGGGVAAGVGTVLDLLPPAAPAAAPTPASLPLITRPIPSSGERLPAIGLGTDAFRTAVHDEIREEIGRMTELGGSVIDTAAAYGDSEELIGDALAASGRAPGYSSPPSWSGASRSFLWSDRSGEPRALAQTAEDAAHRSAAGP